MDKCEECNAEPFEDDSYCRQCGTELPSYNCECGADIDPDDNYCHLCGSPLEGVEEVASDSEDDSDDSGDDEDGEDDKPDDTCCGSDHSQPPQQNW